MTLGFWCPFAEPGANRDRSSPPDARPWSEADAAQGAVTHLTGAVGAPAEGIALGNRALVRAA